MKDFRSSLFVASKRLYTKVGSRLFRYFEVGYWAPSSTPGREPSWSSSYCGSRKSVNTVNFIEKGGIIVKKF